MKKILIPTDFSECANAAVDMAFYLAGKAGAELHFLHLLMTPVDWVKLPKEREALYPETIEAIGKASAALQGLSNRAQHAGLTSQQFLVFDKGAGELSRHLDNYNHDFLVMGSHGTSGVRDLIGSNTQRVIRHAIKPVLVVKHPVNRAGISNIVFASTFDENIQASFNEVLKVAKLMDAHIYLLYVNTPYDFKETEEMEKRMMEIMSLSEIGTCSINIYDSLDEESGILRFASQVNAGLIAMSTYGKKGFRRIMSPSIVESLVNHSELPVLSINFNAR